MGTFSRPLQSTPGSLQFRACALDVRETLNQRSIDVSSGSIRHFLIDALIVLGLSVASLFTARAYVKVLLNELVPSFHQMQFGPAVMIACGHGFESPVYTGIPTLGTFLQANQQDSFDCDDLPPHPPTMRLTGYQLTWRYLITSAGIVLRVRGISLLRLCA